MGFSVECLTADFLQLFAKKNVKIWLSGRRLGIHRQTQVFQGFS